MGKASGTGVLGPMTSDEISLSEDKPSECSQSK
jgi:hypothetical protein